MTGKLQSGSKVENSAHAALPFPEGLVLPALLLLPEVPVSERKPVRTKVKETPHRPWVIHAATVFFHCISCVFLGMCWLQDASREKRCPALLRCFQGCFK